MYSLEDPFKAKRKNETNLNLKSLKLSKRNLIIGLIVIAVILAAGYFFIIKPNGGFFGGTSAEDQKYDQMVTKIKKVILVPDENPTIATIADLAEVQKQNPVFYQDALQGDIVIIFSTKALIYRESEDKIINVAPVTREDSSTDTPAEISPEAE